jgi:hypothetical protein
MIDPCQSKPVSSHSLHLNTRNVRRPNPETLQTALLVFDELPPKPHPKLLLRSICFMLMLCIQDPQIFFIYHPHKPKLTTRYTIANFPFMTPVIHQKVPTSSNIFTYPSALSSTELQFNASRPTRWKG